MSKFEKYLSLISSLSFCCLLDDDLGEVTSPVSLFITPKTDVCRAWSCRYPVEGTKITPSISNGIKTRIRKSSWRCRSCGTLSPLTIFLFPLLSFPDSAGLSLPNTLLIIPIRCQIIRHILLHCFPSTRGFICQLVALDNFVTNITADILDFSIVLSFCSTLNSANVIIKVSIKLKLFLIPRKLNW